MSRRSRKELLAEIERLQLASNDAAKLLEGRLKHISKIRAEIKRLLDENDELRATIVSEKAHRVYFMEEAESLRPDAKIGALVRQMGLGSRLSRHDEGYQGQTCWGAIATGFELISHLEFIAEREPTTMNEEQHREAVTVDEAIEFLRRSGLRLDAASSEKLEELNNRMAAYEGAKEHEDTSPPERRVRVKFVEEAAEEWADKGKGF